MQILDRYMLRQFLQTFAICFCSMTGLYIVFDAFANLDEFMKYGESTGHLLALISEYYFYRSISFFDRMSAVLALISAMFTLAWLQRHNELTAIVAAGIPGRRVIAPIIGATIVISLTAVVSREAVIPSIRKQLSREPRDLLGQAAQEMQPQFDGRTNVLLTGKQTFADRQRIHRADFKLPPGLDEYGTDLVATDAFYQPPQGDLPGGYRMVDVLHPADLADKPSLSLDGVPTLLTALDAPDGLKLGPKECFVASDLSFEQLTAGKKWRQYASTAQLIAGLRNPALGYGDDVRVAIHSRLVMPLLDVTLLFLGLPLVLRPDQRSFFLAVGQCVTLVSVFMVVAIGAQYLGTIPPFSPALASWLPLAIFVPTAVWISDHLWR
ncbi:MAG: LptF/LptG family permease [Pirellulales bacterium]|nr:LptF/LptG family permease [Planctomycetales bacterium]